MYLYIRIKYLNTLINSTKQKHLKLLNATTHLTDIPARFKFHEIFEVQI